MENRRRKVRTWVLKDSVSKVHKGVKPLTRINVKPYTLILRDGKILCGGERQVPLVFDTKALAMGYLEANSIDVSLCQLPEMDLEELAHVCRDPKINFNSFYLIDDQSQINTD
jgi:hypothetical protein